MVKVPVAKGGAPSFEAPTGIVEVEGPTYMNKTEMAKKLAGKTDLTQQKASEVIDAIFDTDPGRGIIAVELDAGNEVAIAGFGKFDTKHRAARQGRNPATGAVIQIQAKKYPSFKASKGLKDRVAE